MVGELGTGIGMGMVTTGPWRRRRVVIRRGWWSWEVGRLREVHWVVGCCGGKESEGWSVASVVTVVMGFALRLLWCERGDGGGKFAL